MIKPAESLCYPGLVVIVQPPLLLWAARHICHGLQVPRLGLQPLVYEQLRITPKALEELPAGLETVDGLNSFVNLIVQGLDLLLGGCGKQEVVYLGLQSIVHLEIY